MNKYLLNLYNFLKSAGQEDEQKAVLNLSKQVMPSSDWDDARGEYGDEEDQETEYLESFPNAKPKNDYELKLISSHLYLTQQEFKDILRKYKIHLTSSEEEGTFIGKGASALVFNCIYQGHPAAFKISRGARTTEIWQEILDLSIPEEFKICLPKIYLLATENLNQQYIPYSIIVMEKLKPLGRYLADTRQQQHNLPKDYSAILNLAQNIFKLIKKEIQSGSFIRWMKDNKTREILAYDNHYYMEIYDFIKNVNIQEHPALNMAIFILENIFGISRDNTYLRDDIKKLLVNYKIEASTESFLPMNYQQFDDPVQKKQVQNLKHNPEYKRLAECLAYLEENGIKFRDLSYSNLMIGEDGMPKIVDTESFSTPTYK